MKAIGVEPAIRPGTVLVLVLVEPIVMSVSTVTNRVPPGA
jgi:hypothetical protein